MSSHVGACSPGVIHLCEWASVWDVLTLDGPLAECKHPGLQRSRGTQAFMGVLTWTRLDLGGLQKNSPASKQPSQNKGNLVERLTDGFLVFVRPFFTALMSSWTNKTKTPRCQRRVDKQGEPRDQRNLRNLRNLHWLMSNVSPTLTQPQRPTFASGSSSSSSSSLWPWRSAANLFST